MVVAGAGCGNDCPAGWTCGTDGICKGAQPFCAPLACTTSSGDHYCGTVGDGCGGTLACGNDCPAGWTCGTDSICKGGPTCTAVACAASNGDHYCGTIGDTCGGTLDCGLTCPKAGWTCQNNVCNGGVGCTPLTCVASSTDNYCGAIGDGCGGTVDCGPTCPKAGWTCNNGLCKGGPDCVANTCTTKTGDQYCDDIGDGCGSTVHCGTTCAKANWTCQDGLCKAGPGANCVPLACKTANGDQYCGVVGDGCGSKVDCGTTCSKTGWTCQGGLCKGLPGVCTSLTCKPASGGQYCGTVGDNCGNSLACGTDCSASGTNWVCGSNSVCVGGPDCVKVACNTTGGVQQYCGDIGDGCGGTLSCPSTCTGGTVCGAASPNVCGCGNLCLKQVACTGGATTSISGTVYDPAGLNPLYNVIVSVPNAPLDPIPSGAACASCDAQVSGQPIATALTDANGGFVLKNVPWGVSFPLVMQLGKWRRQVTILASSVTHQCADNPIVEAKPATLLRLPKNITDGDNNGQYTSMPKIAITTGTIDALECLLTRIGIDTAEFTNPTGTGHINLYSLFASTDTNQTQEGEVVNGATNYVSATGAAFPLAPALLDSVPTLQGYDMVIMNCAAGPNYFAAGGAYVTAARQQNMKTYLDGGGKVFLEHYFSTWLRSPPVDAAAPPGPYGDIATWEYPPVTAASNITAADLLTKIDQSFTKGRDFAQWLYNAGASATVGALQLTNSAVTAIPTSKYTASTVRTPAQRWIYNPNTDDSSKHVHYFDFLTPVEQTSKCGRVVYTGVHVSSASKAADQDKVRKAGLGTPYFPGECVSRALNGQEKALEFMFFDLSGCVTPVKSSSASPGDWGHGQRTATAAASATTAGSARGSATLRSATSATAATAAGDCASGPAASATTTGVPASLGAPCGNAAAATTATPGASARNYSHSIVRLRRAKGRPPVRRPWGDRRSPLLRPFALGPLLTHARKRLACGAGAAIASRGPALQQFLAGGSYLVAGVVDREVLHDGRSFGIADGIERPDEVALAARRGRVESGFDLRQGTAAHAGQLGDGLVRGTSGGLGENIDLRADVAIRAIFAACGRHKQQRSHEPRSSRDDQPAHVLSPASPRRRRWRARQRAARPSTNNTSLMSARAPSRASRAAKKLSPRSMTARDWGSRKARRRRSAPPYSPREYQARVLRNSCRPILSLAYSTTRSA